MHRGPRRASIQVWTWSSEHSGPTTESLTPQRPAEGHVIIIYPQPSTIDQVKMPLSPNPSRLDGLDSASPVSDAIAALAIPSDSARLLVALWSKH